MRTNSVGKLRKANGFFSFFVDEKCTELRPEKVVVVKWNRGDALESKSPSPSVIQHDKLKITGKLQTRNTREEIYFDSDGQASERAATPGRVLPEIKVRIVSTVSYVPIHDNIFRIRTKKNKRKNDEWRRTFQEFETCSTARGHVRDFVLHAEISCRGGRVATPNHGGRAALRHVRHHLQQGFRAVRKVVPFEHAHRSRKTRKEKWIKKKKNPREWMNTGWKTHQSINQSIPTIKMINFFDHLKKFREWRVICGWIYTMRNQQCFQFVIWIWKIWFGWCGIWIRGKITP